MPKSYSRRTLSALLTALLLGFGLSAQKDPGVSLVVLGNVQDGGSPHIGCVRECCAGLTPAKADDRRVVSLGLVDHGQGQTYLFEATPDIGAQLRDLREYSGTPLPAGIFLTHAHIGHYAGLQFLGREALNAPGVPVYALPRMESYLRENGPWGQLVSLGNIALRPLGLKNPIALGPDIQVEAIAVPHRDEYSETAGFLIRGPSKSALFIPDIDKWERWGESLSAILAEVDYAFLDATFYDAVEVGYRDISEIPHPLVTETQSLLQDLPPGEKAKVYFIHMNHTNPLLDASSPETRQTEQAGYHVARRGQTFSL
ncbi:MBL fold metallo-hydrolase [Robiginitalea sediminis]|uniref:MBL fold metallo-hydrolase n=1 Tax=Robiginitalea sediminis TaxID=1982593 RepID=UPI000B4C1CDD|nr:MBL fold metallo-hydrolase [Robiginitalea sediminis]